MENRAPSWMLDTLASAHKFYENAKGTPETTTLPPIVDKMKTVPLPTAQGGGYKPTARNLYYLRKYKRGKSIGFTMKASLKAKGLIPRESRKLRGRKVVGNKYRSRKTG